MGLTTVAEALRAAAGAEALRAARWVNPILVHYVHKVHYVHTFDERPWTPTAFFRMMRRDLATRGSAPLLYAAPGRDRS